ncbi:homeobox-like protein HDP1 [Centruroides vittatus]|uniref:homeobox-like protein HDP1 n=1 Tax=Centruroides vittatus TaxID=120091 RepID=UPI00350FBF9E
MENGEIFASGANINLYLQPPRSNKEKSFIPLVLKPTFENDNEVTSAENVISDPTLGVLHEERFVSKANITLSLEQIAMPESKVEELKDYNKIKHNYSQREEYHLPEHVTKYSSEIMHVPKKSKPINSQLDRNTEYFTNGSLGSNAHSVSDEGELYSTSCHHKTLTSQDKTNFNIKTVTKFEIDNEKRSLNSPYNKKYISVANISLRPTSAEDSDKKDEEMVNKNEDDCRNYYGRSTKLSEFQIADTKQRSNTKTKSNPSQINKSTVVLVNDLSEKQFYFIRNRQEESLITTEKSAKNMNDTDYTIHTNESYKTELKISVSPINQVRKDVSDNKNELDKKENENIEGANNEPISLQFPYCKSELSNVRKSDSSEKARVDIKKESSVSSTLKEKKEIFLTSDDTKLSSNLHFTPQNVKLRQNVVCAKLKFPLEKTQKKERKFDGKDLIQLSTSFHQSDQSRYEFKERLCPSNEENKNTKDFGKIKNRSHYSSNPLKKFSGKIITGADMNRNIRLQQKAVNKDWRLHCETDIKERASHDSRNRTLCTNTIAQTHNTNKVTSSHRNYQRIKTTQTLTQSNINKNNALLPCFKETPCNSICSSTITKEASSPSKNVNFTVLAASAALNLIVNVIVENIDYKQAILDWQSAISRDYVRRENVIYATSCYPENLSVTVSATETLNSSITMQNEQCYRSCNFQPFETVVEVYPSTRLTEEGNFNKIKTTLNAVTVSPKEVYQCIRATVAEEWKSNAILQPEIYGLCQERINNATRQSSLYISKLNNLRGISKNDLMVATEDLPHDKRNFQSFDIEDRYEKNKIKILQKSSRVPNSKTRSHINNKDIIFNKMSKRKKERKINSVGTYETKFIVSPKLCDFEVSAGKKNLKVVDTLEVVPMERNREENDLEKRNSKWLPYMARKDNNWCNVAIQTDETVPEIKYSSNVKQQINERKKFQNMPRKMEDDFDFELNKRKIKPKHQNHKNNQIKIKKLKSSKKHDNFENSKNFLYPILNIGMKFLENLENSDK